MYDMICAPSITELYWKWPKSMSRRAGWNKSVTSAACCSSDELEEKTQRNNYHTCVLEERVACHVRVKAYNAGTYMRASRVITLKRMNNLFPGVSIPREVSRANHDGSIHDPLEARMFKCGVCNKVARSLTFSHISKKHKLSMEGNRGPNIAGHNDTIVEQGGGLLTPSSVAVPHNHQTLGEWHILNT